LIISLTSYAHRFNTIEATLRCLLSQSVSPDVVILWISKDDRNVLPQGVQNLRSSHFVIETTEDIRSYTKIIPCLQAAPKAFIVTADDDAYYPENWLETLVNRYNHHDNIVPCNRAHKIRVGEDGEMLSYADWEQETESQEASRYIFPTGVGGVLYKPGVFYSDVTNKERFQRLCPTADDVWLFWMSALNGNMSRTSGLQNRPVTWPSSQLTSLRTTNMPRGAGNDTQIANMRSAYGHPL
jgi:hypothetical protein